VQVWEIPQRWSLRDAATVPVAYLTAYYALVMRGGLEAGQKVLVHSGTGAVGLAAIRICLHRGVEVRQFWLLMALPPVLPVKMLQRLCHLHCMRALKMLLYKLH
jgi:hypothetical protein